MTEQPKKTDRRRPHWREFRRAYPGFTFTMTLGVLILLALNGFALYKRDLYQKETARLREEMTGAERQRADLIVEEEKNKVAIAMELAKRQARVDNELHLSVQTDSGRMYLEREGAILRVMVVQVGAEQKVSKKALAQKDSVPIAIPRGERTIASFTPGTIQLDGGTRIYAVDPADSAAVAVPVTPGDVRASAADIKAISANLKPGMKVYFF